MLIKHFQPNILCKNAINFNDDFRNSKITKRLTFMAEEQDLPFRDTRKKTAKLFYVGHMENHCYQLKCVCEIF